MKLKNRYSFDDEIAKKFCYDNVNKCIQIYFSGYFDFMVNKHLESKCKFVISNWKRAKSKIIDREEYGSLESNLGIINPSMRIDWSGEPKLDYDDYDRAGISEDATREHPARNQKRPKKPAAMNQESTEGLYYSLAYAIAGIEYALNMGDPTYVQQSGMIESEQQQFIREHPLEDIRNHTYWENNPRYEYKFLDPHPQKNGDQYSWDYKLYVAHGSYYVSNGQVHDTTLSSTPKPDEKPSGEYYRGTITGKYTNGAWVLSGFFNGEKKSSSS